ncbi:hypothetical protein GGE65_007112 [Skermanella aerolata]|uniref:SrfA family protein n=1 Tax=Skermanella aerolata TaxID=393310 RepID=UPI003D23C922
MTTRTGPLLITDSLDRYQPLGAFGQPIYLSHVQLKAAVRQKLGSRFAHLFARPDRDPRSGVIRWISDVPGEAVRWRDLPPERQFPHALAIEELRSGFASYLNDLRTMQGTDQAQAFANLLEGALRVPDDGHIFLVDDQPVTTFWGFSDGSGAGFEALSAAPAKVPEAAVEAPPALSSPAPSPAVPPVMEPAPAHRSGWWRWLPWLLLALLLLGLALFGLRGCVPGLDLIVPTVPGEERGTFQAPEDRLPGSPAPSGPVPSAPVPGEPRMIAPGAPVGPGAGEPPGTQAVPPLADAQPEQPQTEPVPPEAPPADALPPLPPATDAPDPAAPPKPELSIPANPAEAGRLDYLEGLWRSREGLVERGTGVRLQQFYRFDRSGRGQVVIRKPDGAECRAPAQASYGAGGLTVDELADPLCPDGQTYARSRTVCQREADGRTDCRGTNADGYSYRVGIEQGF